MPQDYLPPGTLFSQLSDNRFQLVTGQIWSDRRQLTYVDTQKSAEAKVKTSIEVQIVFGRPHMKHNTHQPPNPQQTRPLKC